jgi:hypothetical protein
VHWIDLNLDRNEASDMLPVTDQDVLHAHGWDRAYWILLDEDQLDDAVGIVGHPAGAELHEGWEHHSVPTDCGPDAHKTDDSEAAATYDGWVYALGSHFGGKQGPLQIGRHWIARWHEDALPGVIADATLPISVVRNKFRLHRLINDALAAHADALVPVHDALTDAFVTPARVKGEKKGKAWASRVRDGDYPLNIEGAAFRRNGNLLVGLRFPVGRAGGPVLVELAGVPELFATGTWPTVAGVWLLTGPGSPEEWMGIRAMTTRGDDVFDVICGNLDAVDKPSLLLECHPQGRTATSEHWRFSLQGRVDGGAVESTLVNAFGQETRIEGLAPGPSGHFIYVVDEDSRVHIKFLAVD